MSDALYRLPKQVVFCGRCVISNQWPNSAVEFRSDRAENKRTIAFDGDGICATCIKDKEID